MSSQIQKLPPDIKKMYEANGPDCQIVDCSVRDLSDYFAVFDNLLPDDTAFWFRGHSDLVYRLVPSALRYKREPERNRAISLLADFRRLAEIKLDRPPSETEELKWLQLAQHYGLCTRLLDWTENAAAALYFACGGLGSHGLVAILNPIDLNQSAFPQKRPQRIFDAHLDANVIKPYLRLTGRANARGRRTIAILPILNSPRIALQKGVFTLHGSRTFELDSSQVSSLIYLPILNDVKPRLLRELDRVGINKMSLFPELEHVCEHLKRKARLA